MLISTYLFEGRVRNFNSEFFAVIGQYVYVLWQCKVLRKTTEIDYESLLSINR